MRNKNAFSLVELLVVMGVIAVLSVLAVFGITEVQKNARDTERKTKVQEITSKLDRIALNGGSLPDHFKWGDQSATHIVIANERITLNGSVQRKLPDADLGQLETTNTATDYCYTISGKKYLVGVMLESGGFFYQTNTNDEYLSTQSFYSNPVDGSGLRCIDGNL
jgi:prepilin-type N-terminal cleavage/methylation domain-containing protein